MSKTTLTGFALLFLLFLGNTSGNYAAQATQNTSDAPTGTLQKMIVENGSVTINLDLNRLNGINSTSQILTSAFRRRGEFLFPILVFNELLRGPTPGTMALIPQSVPTFPGALGASFNRLVIEKLPSGRIRSCRARRQHRIHVFQY